MKLNDFLAPFENYHDERDSTRYDLIRLMKVLKPHYNISCNRDLQIMTLRCYLSELVTLFISRDDKNKEFKWCLAWITDDFMMAQSHYGKSFIDVSNQALLEIDRYTKVYDFHSFKESLVNTMREISRIRESFESGKTKDGK